MSKSTRNVLSAFRRFMAEARFVNGMSVAEAWSEYRKIVNDSGREFARQELLANYGN